MVKTWILLDFRDQGKRASLGNEGEMRENSDIQAGKCTCYMRSERDPPEAPEPREDLMRRS